MRLMCLFFASIWLFLVSSCGNSSDEEYPIEGQTEEGFEDGTYCAEVDYYNPNTGTSNSYTLEVEVSGNEVIQINFNNGGWLDEDHIDAESLDSDGTCTLVSDRGYEYTVHIIGRDCSSTDESSMDSDVQEDEQAVTCPNCGGEKEDYEDICYSCQLDEESY
jgi:hypothetical protein